MSVRLPYAIALETEIACEKRSYVWVRTPKGRRKEWSTETLWSATHKIPADRLMRFKDVTTIPIDVPLPGDKLPFALDAEGVGIQWTLYVRTDYEVKPPRPGEPHPRYEAQFLVPVFARN